MELAINQKNLEVGNLKQKDTLKLTKRVLMSIFTLLVCFLMLSPNAAFAEKEGDKKDPPKTATNANITNGLTKAGASTTINDDSLFKDLNAGLVLIIGIGVIWTVACIIWSAMKLASSQGQAQKRVEGLVGLGFAGFGGWVIYNAYNIYGWFTSIGGSV